MDDTFTKIITTLAEWLPPDVLLVVLQDLEKYHSEVILESITEKARVPYAETR